MSLVILTVNLVTLLMEWLCVSTGSRLSLTSECPIGGADLECLWTKVVSVDPPIWFPDLLSLSLKLTALSRSHA